MLKRRGQEFTINVSIENAIEIASIDAWISYNPNIIEVVDSDPLTPGTQVQAEDFLLFVNSRLLVSVMKDMNGNELPGTLICGYASVPAVGNTVNGDCFSILFKAIAPGTTEISFSKLVLYDVAGNAISAIPIDDSVDVAIDATVKITVI